MPSLPTGTVTFLFSDIEGSTRLARQLGPGWADVLSEHRRVVRASMTAHGGVEVGGEGDSFFFAFPSAVGAVAAAADAQRALAAHDWPKDAALRVRIGVHTTGAAEVVEGNYAGVEVHRAARIMSAGHGGQTLVSSATRALTENSLPPGASLKDLGEHRLRDIDEPAALSQLCLSGLTNEFPPLRSVDGSRSTLPTPATSLVGRSDDVRRVRALLGEQRLVTLTGPGGTGKTRLALAVAGEELDTFEDGVHFVALASIREPELVAPAIAKAIGINDPGPEPIRRVAEQTAGKRMLVVLDNVEQVLAAAGDIGEVLRQAPGLRLLVTSRAPLRVYGEQEYAVPPLPMPDPSSTRVDRTVGAYPAPALFADRARQVKPDFEITDENAQAVAEICWRLDGLPLAIELAAARIRILTPQAMLARLAKRLDLGTGGSKDLPERQQTLRGAIAWSYEILDAGEQRFFSAFSVFRGAADLETVDAVLGAYAEDVLHAVEALVDRSLVRQEETPDGAPRFRMLETIREFAEEQLAARADDDASVRRSHAEHFLRRAEDASSRVFSDDQRGALDTLEGDHDNIRAALSWASGAGEAVFAYRMVAACWRFWQMRGYLIEAEERVARVLEIPEPDGHRAELAAFLEAAGGLAYWAGEMHTAEARYARALAIQREIGDDAAVANALYNFVLSFGRDEQLPISVAPERVAAVEEALAIYRRLGDRAGEGRALWAMLDIEILQLDADRAAEIGDECLRIFTEVGDRFMLGWTEYMLGLNAALREDRRTARGHVLRALELFRAAEDVSAYGLVLDSLAASAFAEGHRLYAMRLAGGGDAIQRQGGAYLARLNRQWAGFHPERLLDDPELAAAWQEGREMPLGELLDLAVAGPQDDPPDQAGAARSRRGNTVSA